MTIILASTSPRRADLLKKTGLSFIVAAPEVAEVALFGEPVLTAETNALKKAQDVFKRRRKDTAGSGCIVIGSDTVVALGGRILGKPDSEAQAAEMLLSLSGRTHEVVTGIAVVGDDTETVGHEISLVTFKKFDIAVIKPYINSGKPMDKAGAYGLQDPEIEAVTDGVKGERDNVIGLPVALLKRMLQEKFSWLF